MAVSLRQRVGSLFRVFSQARGIEHGNVCLKARSVQTATKNVDETTVAAITQKLDQSELGRLFAVVHLSGLQRKVTPQDIIAVHSPILADIGERIRLNKVLLVGGKDFTLVGRPVLGSDVVRVEATVIEKTLSQPQTCFWYHKRKNNRKFHLRQENLVMLLINSVEVGKLPGSGS